MNLRMNARVRFPDGEEAGRLTRLVAVPGQPERAAVIATPGLISRQVVVPLGWLHETLDGAVQVELDADTLDALPEYLPPGPLPPGGLLTHVF